jgi:polar amino acid transport system substrate-binding protein
MKKFTFIILVIFICFNVFSQSKQTEVVFVCEDKENFPDLMGNGIDILAQNPGVSVELIKKLEPMANIKITFKRMPWKRCLEVELKNGTADGAFLASYKTEREEMGTYPMKNGKPDTDKRVTTTSYVFYKLKGSGIDWDGKALINFDGVIGAPAGYSIVGDLTGMGYKVIESDTSLKGLKQLLANKLALFATLDEQGDFILSKNAEFTGKIEKIKTPLASKPYYLMLSKQFVAKNPELSAKIWDSIKILREKEYSKLSLKYFK